MSIDKNRLATEVCGTGMGSNDLRELGLKFGLKDEFPDDIDLQVAIICEEEGVWNCEVCNWWVEEDELTDRVCRDCNE